MHGSRCHIAVAPLLLLPSDHLDMLVSVDGDGLFSVFSDQSGIIFSGSAL
jgi:hypothetical protein